MKTIPPYVERTEALLEAELEGYLKQRREANGIEETAAPDNLNGLCISGGGVRSATLGLGMMQAFMKAGKMKYFDYMSTVSGGGYIGSCLSSILSEEPGSMDKENTLTEKNKRFDTTDFGLDAENSPFLTKEEDYEYKQIQEAKLNSRQQLNHMRRRGEYLTPNKSLFGWDVNRAIGSLAGGAVMNFTMLLLISVVGVSLHHLLFHGLSGGDFIKALQYPVETLRVLPGSDVGQLATWDEAIKAPAYAESGIMDQLGVWYTNHLSPQFSLIFTAAGNFLSLPLGFLGLGALMGLVLVLFSTRIPFIITEGEYQEQIFNNKENRKHYDRASGESLMQARSRFFLLLFNFVCYLFGPLAAYGLGVVLQVQGVFGASENYFVVLILPLAFSLGMYLSVNLLISLYFINSWRERVSGRLYRSFYSGMQGASLLGLFVAAGFPLLIILLFGRHGAAVKLSVSYLPVLFAYMFAMQSVGDKKAEGIIGKLMKSLQMPLLNLSIYLFVGILLAWVSKGLYELELIINETNMLLAILALFAGGLVLLVFFGYRSNANDISLHYFYRDRLTEAYLRTDGRAKVPEDLSKSKLQRKGLIDLLMRNHENLMLKDLGNGNGKGPYHLIVGALNLQGSNDLARRSLKSDHFIFSKFFVGSRTTGYVNTSYYIGGRTRLSAAMAISAAAVASGMGALSFAASNFYMTLFNLRTGYWVDNPWYYILEAKANGQFNPGWLRRMWRKYTHSFWLFYLWRELTGKLSADTPRVNISDGGHTGDNLGLMPLIQRKCRNIVVADFEEDKTFSFASFNQAVYLSKAVYNADIHIKLSDLMPEKDEKTGMFMSAASVTRGEITYSDGSKGSIVYMKSAVNLLKEMSENEASTNSVPGFSDEPAPVFVLNYFKTNPDFPHQSTVDQYFDEAQFEAYRMLGEHIGKQGARMFNS